MPSVLTKDGWEVFNTQKEADEFRAKMEAQENIINAGMQEDVAPESEQALRMDETDGAQAEAERKPADEGDGRTGLLNLKKKIGRRN